MQCVEFAIMYSYKYLQKPDKVTPENYKGTVSHAEGCDLVRVKLEKFTDFFTFFAVVQQERMTKLYRYTGV